MSNEYSKYFEDELETMNRRGRRRDRRREIIRPPEDDNGDEESSSSQLKASSIEDAKETLQFYEEYATQIIEKDADDILNLMSLGIVDLTVDTGFWKDPYKAPVEQQVLVTPIVKPIGRATKGFSIKSMTINDALSTIIDIVENNREDNFIQFRIHSKDVENIQFSIIDTDFAILNDIVSKGTNQWV